MTSPTPKGRPRAGGARLSFFSVKILVLGGLFDAFVLRFAISLYLQGGQIGFSLSAALGLILINVVALTERAYPPCAIYCRV